MNWRTWDATIVGGSLYTMVPTPNTDFSEDQ